jgi:geranylgeranyl diphosphate synthase type I
LTSSVNAAHFQSFAAHVRAEVDGHLAGWLNQRVAQAKARGAEVAVVADAVSQLVLRGGKRLRAILLAASFEACGGEGGAGRIVAAAAALELLQGYLLVHDDWMDGDDVRRGGPSVPAMMRSRFGRHADAASILAGDLACGWAQSSLLETEVPAGHLLRAARELAIVQEEVVSGQTLDVCGEALDASAVDTVYELKTASYTVRGPVLIGAHLAGARDGQVVALEEYARPLGVAFQLRDDLLGVFGDPGATGKPWGSDLREGKRTALVLDAVGRDDARQVLERVLGRSDATDDDVRRAVDCLQASGARARVEERISELASSARCALERAELTDRGRQFLLSCTVAMTERAL